MKNFTLNHSTKQIYISGECSLSDIINYFKINNLDVMDWVILTSNSFIERPVKSEPFVEIKHPLIERPVKSEPYFKPPPTISM